jgi:hypothetical protein
MSEGRQPSRGGEEATCWHATPVFAGSNPARGSILDLSAPNPKEARFGPATQALGH